MRVASLCSGYDGIFLGLEMVEPCELIWHAELDPHAAAIHEHHWPGLPNAGDITACDWAELEPPDLLTAGYPCQPFSHAGRRQGANDDRHLWPHVAEAVRVLRPRRVLLENVAGHLTLGFGDVLGDLAEAGYDARWCCVRASDVGAPHRRERVFVVATDTRSAGTRGNDRAVPGQVQGRPHLDVRTPRDDRRSAADADGERLTGWQEPHKRPIEPGLEAPRRCDSDGLGATPWGPFAPAIRRWEHLTRTAPRPTDDRGRLNPPFVEWMMGLPDGWVTSIDIGRTAQLKALGNGVVPHAAARAWTLLR